VYGFLSVAGPLAHLRNPDFILFRREWLRVETKVEKGTELARTMLFV
jgi:hypothetical protein